MNSKTVKDPRRERAQFARRAWIGLAVVMLGLGGLSARFFWLQVVKHQEYVTRSNQNSIHVRYLVPPRGMILDRHGVVLAENQPAFRLVVIPDRVPHMQAMLTRLKQVVPWSRDDLRRFKQGLKEHRPFQPVPLRMRLNQDEIARFAINRWRFPGVEVQPYLRRYYPYGALFAHVVGYVGRVNQREAARLRDTPYAELDQIGKTGIERYYEDRLRGQPGYELVEVDADGRPVHILQRIPPKPGQNLYLSLDVGLQQAAYTGLAGRDGAAVAIDPRNGQVLAMVSSPSFDPNLFVGGISEADYRSLLENPHWPLLDRALRGMYPPGSTIKPYLAVAGLELGVRTPQDTVLSTGEFYIPGHSRGYRDDVRGGFGRVDLVQAIEMSVNTYFYKLALDMGITRMDTFMAKFGFGRATGIDLQGEARGVLPSPAWKRARFGKPWYLGETVIAGIGQGYWVITPLQLTHALAILADRGVPHTPRLLLATQNGPGAPVRRVPTLPAGQPVIAKHQDWKVVVQGMEKVVYGKRGTARGLGDGFPFEIAGKTGTAERYSRTTRAWEGHLSTAELAKLHRALFEGFTPANDPQIAAVAILGSAAWGGQDAAPIVRKIFDAWAQQRGLPDHTLRGDYLTPAARPPQVRRAAESSAGGVP